MVNMTANPVVEWVQPSRAFTREDLERMPDDGHRYELIDGLLIVAPAPSEGHQDVVVSLVLRLAPLCPPDLKVLVAPFAVILGDDTEVQPDVLVVRRSPVPRAKLDGPPEIAIEIASPSTKHLDRSLKRDRYEAAGCPAYWIVDPAEPSIIALELIDGTYVEIGRAVGPDELRVTKPFPVALVPAALIGGA